MKAFKHLSLLVVVCCFSSQLAAQQGATMSGVVSNRSTGEKLPGANVILAEPGGLVPITGTTTDFDGFYELAGMSPGEYDLVVRYIGFEEFRESVTITAGSQQTVDAALSESGVSLNTVVVSASRQEEKILDAPASISVLQAREIEHQPTSNTAATMRNTTGVDIAQTGADRYELVLRGFSNAFSGSTFSLVDYRQGAVPSLGVNAWILMPLTNIDTDRIEVVRGAGSALYGAGVDAGVIHVVTKDPFSSPGTTISLLGGERMLGGATFRHAGVAGGNVGYKVVGSYSRVDDWELDPLDPVDFEQLDANGDGVLAYENEEVFYELNDAGRVEELSGPASVVDFDIPREYDTEKWKVNGMLQYRLSPTRSLILNAGHSEATSPILTGIGTAQAIGFGYSYGQVRFQSGSFFAQAYLNQNQAGDSFVYGTGDPLVDSSRLFNTQAQYDMRFAQERERLIVGVDFEQTVPDTDGTIYGRNEDEDTISEFGVYAQSATRVSDSFDLTLAARLDYNNIVEQFQVSPRAAMVYKLSDDHSIRATYNRAFSSPGNNSLFLDIVAGQQPVAPGFLLNVRGRGAVDGFSYLRNPAYAAFSPSDIVATSNLPFEGLNEHFQVVEGDTVRYTYDWNTNIPVGADLATIYDLVYGSLSQLSRDDINAALGVEIPENLFPLLQSLLAPDATRVEGFVPGQLARPSLDGGAELISDVQPIDPLEQTTSQTIELGYKGLIGNKVLLAVDGYWSRKKDFVGPLLFESPIVIVPTLAAELEAALADGIGSNTSLNNILRTLQNLNPDLDFSAEGVAEAIAGLAAESLPGPSDPIGVVQPVENMNGPLGPELLLTYRNFGEIDFFGVDVSTQYFVNREVTVFGNVSWVSDDFFDAEEVGEPGTNKIVALNAAALKVKGGVSYDQVEGLSLSASGRYNDEFPVASGPYVGTVPDYFVLDLGAGYDFAKWVSGLRVDVLMQNALNNEHREFVGAPQIGRMTTFRATFKI